MQELYDEKKIIEFKAKRAKDLYNWMIDDEEAEDAANDKRRGTVMFPSLEGFGIGDPNAQDSDFESDSEIELDHSNDEFDDEMEERKRQFQSKRITSAKQSKSNILNEVILEEMDEEAISPKGVNAAGEVEFIKQADQSKSHTQLVEDANLRASGDSSSQSGLQGAAAMGKMKQRMSMKSETLPKLQFEKKLKKLANHSTMAAA